MVIADKGLVYFDGTNFEQFTTGNSDIHDNDPTLVTVDAAGVVWFGGFNYNGSSSYDGSTFISYLLFDSDLPTNNIRQMKTAANGDLWMATSVGLIQLATEPSSSKEIPLLRFSISPNPTQGVLNIQMDGEVQLLDILRACSSIQ